MTREQHDRPDRDQTLNGLAQEFERFARQECGESPLYQRLAGAIARDPDLLRLAAHGDHGPKPNLLLGAVHYVLMADARDPLAAFYPSVSVAPAPITDPVPAFRAFCLLYAKQIQELMQTRRVQTNEVARCAILLPGFALVAQRAAAPSLQLVEVGASAGLLLHWERYGYDYGDAWHVGRDREVVIPCEVRGTARPPFPDRLPSVRSRIGIDLHPIDLEDADQARWLQALVWPDQPERAGRLGRAVAVARQQPAPLIAGDATVVLPGLLSALPMAGELCLFHAHTLNQFAPDDRRRYVELLAEHSRRRSLYDLSLEYVSGDHPQMELRRFRDGAIVEQRTLARYDAHGRWVEWNPSAI
ncbi:MAG: DUF2332 domain-containing protein [Dehalococcoidia bacterium]